MSWERDPLWVKSRLFLGYAFTHDREDHRFGLWCAMGLELLARAAISSISPTLLAEPDREHRHLLHALNRGSDKVTRKSITTSHVLNLCRIQIPGFTSELQTTANALINCRNDELHTGSSIFNEYTTQQWVSGFYACCKVLSEFLDESLDTLLGNDEATVAHNILNDTEQEVLQRVQQNIAAYRRVFEEKPDDERTLAADLANKEVERLRYLRHHKVACPACKCDASVMGETFGPVQVIHADYEITTKQAVLPNTFACKACGLKLTGYAELRSANLADQFTRTTQESPEEYYGLIDPNDEYAVNNLLEEHLRNMEEYNNE